MLTTICSAGCSHCPFSNPRLEPLHLSADTLIKILNQTNEKLAVLSGGEPFEHPEISKILNNLSEVTIPVRIATGGFVKLDPWIEQLEILSKQNAAFKGISIGTDVLSNRVTRSVWAAIWEHNIHLLIKAHVPFSLTFTISPEFQLDYFSLSSWTKTFNGMPEFIYLRYSDVNHKNAWLERIQAAFGYVIILQDDIHSA